MQHSRLCAIALAAAFAAAVTLGFGPRANAQPYGGGWGMMGNVGPGYGPGYGMMGGYGPGYGMMGGYGPGCYGPATMNGGCGPGMGYGPGYGRGDLNLSTDNVRDYFARWIAAQGNTHLKVGDVKEQGTDTIVADIVTQDNSLVQEFVVDRHTGIYRPEQTNPSTPGKPTAPSNPTNPPSQK
jgi:hypothetical protein